MWSLRRETGNLSQMRDSDLCTKYTSEPHTYCASFKLPPIAMVSEHRTIPGPNLRAVYKSISWAASWSVNVPCASLLHTNCLHAPC